VLRLGAMPTSKPVLQYLERHPTARQLVVDAPGGWQEPTALASAIVHADAASLCRALAVALAPGAASTPAPAEAPPPPPPAPPAPPRRPPAPPPRPRQPPPRSHQPAARLQQPAARFRHPSPRFRQPAAGVRGAQPPGISQGAGESRGAGFPGPTGPGTGGHR